MFRIEAVCVYAVFLGVLGPMAHAPVGAQDSAPNDEREGPAPVDSTQSLSAGADDDVGQDRAAGPNTGSSGHASGAYAGVVPGSAKQVPPAAKAARASNGAPTITWPGFQMRPDGSSRVFIQSTQALEPKVLSGADGKFELQLPRARIAAKTNRLPLDTRFFNTPVTKVSVNAARSGAVVQLELRAGVTPQITTEAGPTGYFFTYIELPKGDYLKGPKVASGDNAPAMHMPKPSKVIGKAATAATPAPSSSSSVQGEASLRGGIKLGH